MQTHEPDSDKLLIGIGFWADTHARGRGPDPRLLVDPTWARNDRARLVDYLGNGVVWRAYLGVSSCRFECGIAREQMGSLTLSDGVWAWPSGLAHYVTAHHIALPDEFLAHARAQGFQIDPRLASQATPGETRSVALPENGTAEWWHGWAAARNAITPVAHSPLTR